jgi:hypothetical protein
MCEWSHPIVIGHMGVEYNHLGEECELRKASHKRGNLYGLGEQVLSTQALCMGRKERERKRAWSWCSHGGRTLECNWSVTRANWSWRTE